MKVHVIKRGITSMEEYHNPQTKIEVTYCGYLEVENPLDRDLWHLCNYSCWAEECPVECEHLLISYCNSDVAFCINGVWYSHAMHKYSSFEACYNDMINRRSENYRALWSHEGGFINDGNISYVTPENINQFINN
jgi:hypothetical protein